MPSILVCSIWYLAAPMLLLTNLTMNLCETLFVKDRQMHQPTSSEREGCCALISIEQPPPKQKTHVGCKPNREHANKDTMVHRKELAHALGKYQFGNCHDGSGKRETYIFVDTRKLHIGWAVSNVHKCGIDHLVVDSVLSSETHAPCSGVKIIDEERAHLALPATHYNKKFRTLLQQLNTSKST
jgi:hypothetical protein